MAKGVARAAQIETGQIPMKPVAHSLRRAYSARMMTSIECLAKADALDAMANSCPEGNSRDSFFRTAEGWRRAAILARQQESLRYLNLDR